MKTRARTSVLSVLLCAVLISLSANAAPGERETLEMNDDEDSLFVPVYIFDHWRSFVLDTGAARTVLHSAFTNHLAYFGQAKGSTPSAEHVVAVFRGEAMLVGNVWRRPDYVGGADLRAMEETLGRTVDGVLGLDVLSHYVVRMDFEAKTISFETNAPAPARVGLPMDAELFGRPAFEAVIGSNTVIRAVLDTGFRGELALSVDDWPKAFPNVPTVKKMIKRVDSRGTMSETEQVRLPLLTIGSQRYTNVICDRLTSTNVCSLIGIELLRGHAVTINYPDRLIDFRRLKTTPPSLDEMSGMRLIWTRGSAIVSDLQAGRPATKAGLAVGDEILRINGKPIWTLKKKEVRRMLNGPENATVEILLLRGDKTISAQLIATPEI